MPVPRLEGRSRRLALVLPVVVSGEDLAGHAFNESTSTLNVSGGGLAFATRRRILMGSRLVLEVRLPPRLRRHFAGRDTYRVRAVVCRLVVPEGGPAQVGVRFLGEA
jgi:hypothetical protein